ncbi:flagellar hook protein FlgE [Methylosinus sp. Sm6]|uniref:flagellar hook protein FlgE n=1 Tax=Methylosinus sp. Sm6 TaxID=2866948 RepID=UPI001C998E33|nr:flagellar hook protein FlgE [Methylosinus sp. Sm6]MBY6240583.1 flagellar hook protein FlgE [Methylosinus sp. Sm6]
MTATALFNTSVMGMAAQASALGAVSQNIANSGTVGYKDATTQFSTVLSSVQNGGDPAGGVLAQTGTAVTAQGNTQSTSSTTDLAIQGSGFFVVSDDSGNTLLTRAGSFEPDAEGRLVNKSGYYLMGYSASDTNSPSDIAGLQTIHVAIGSLIATPSTEGSLTANLPQNAETVDPSTLPSSNDPSATYTSKTSVTAYDNYGNSVKLDVYFSKTADNEWEMSVYDSSKADASGGFPYSEGPITTQSLSFDSSGALTSGSPATIAVPNGQTLTLDLSDMTQLGSPFSVSDPTVDGNAAQAVASVNVDSDGTLNYVLTGGQTVPAFKIPLANVSSPTGLQSLSGNAFATTASSGTAYVGLPGSGSFGDIESKSLESSTVDLATQLSNMIVAQRSYTANSQVFQVASEVMQVLNNLK